jgi:ABC-type Fe3+ transport system permease subunit
MMHGEDKAVSTLPEGGVLEAPKRTLFQENWILFRKNRLAMAGLVIFILFFLVAVAGVFLTRGRNPVFDPALVRLQEKLRPPLARPNLETLKPGEVPPFGIYLFGTDDLGRDVFSRMLQGAWVSLTVGFVAVGIAVVIGVFLGGIAGYYGHKRIQLDHLLSPVLLGGGVIGLVSGRIGLGLVLLFVGLGLVGGSLFFGNGRGARNGPVWFSVFSGGYYALLSQLLLNSHRGGAAPCQHL